MLILAYSKEELIDSHLFLIETEKKKKQNKQGKNIFLS